MGLKLNFIVKNTKQIGINQTFQDSSTRTSVLKKNAQYDKLKLPSNQVDKNLVRHRTQLLRNSGSVPRKCLGSTRFAS
jgi:hypothetical protein